MNFRKTLFFSAAKAAMEEKIRGANLLQYLLLQKIQNGL
jgi:hypothetical protein